MERVRGDRSDKPSDFEERESLCIAQPIPNHVLHKGDDGYREELRRHYRVDESNATEQLIKFKATLKACRTEEEFWPMATEGLAALTGAQYAFISKRIVVDDEDAPVEMPPLGEKGSCLMAQALYFNDGHGNKGNPTNVKYHAYGCPCAFMKHDKILIIPERLNEFIIDNPNQAGFVVPAEAHIALPLKDNAGKCFAHFGVMWSKEGLSTMHLSWAFIEMMFHSLEDTLLAGFLERGRFASALKAAGNPKAVIPHEAVTAAQSLKPYARSLSHELRTPMQGVVGMLDVMYATVQEAAEGHSNNRAIRAIFENLKDNIEVVQDSSRRAVEAADNVVHAYDMDMGVPDTPISPPEDEEEGHLDHKSNPKTLGIVVTGENVPIIFKNHKRRRDGEEHTGANVNKYRRTYRSAPISPKKSPLQAHVEALDAEARLQEGPPGLSDPGFCPPGLRHTSLRDVLQFLVNDLLKVGGRPESAIAQEKEGGEEIEVRVRSPNGDEKIKTVHWTVHPGVPNTILIDEQSLVKVISAIYSNAIKFTEEGKIELHVRLSPRSRYVVLTVSDSGSGIRDDFRPKLFRAFSKEDDSLTRHSEGLGLGLMVAKGLARKLGGDLLLARTNTSGPNRGSEFELRIPVTPGDIISRPTTPSGGSPAPSRTSSPAHTEERPVHIRGRSDSLRPYLTSVHPSMSSPRVRSPARIRGDTPSPPYVPFQSSTATTPSAIRPDNFVKTPSHRPAMPKFDRLLSQKYPLTFLVVEDNEINRKLLVSMLSKLGYKAGRDVYEAYNGSDAVRKVQLQREKSVETKGQHKSVDVVLMDLWMPLMDGYEATQKILAMDWDDDVAKGEEVGEEDAAGSGLAMDRGIRGKRPTILAVTADVTEGALEKAASVGMKGFLTKPFKLVDLEKLILEYCATRPTTKIGTGPITT
ncbi:hypothetical protein EJ08DRAFT_44096 [Tothia fuscella]|uniref:histidine kinase n=1 Tax=Tothia fuscella TaxID=1048955 RepID=A0A9P4TST4_9PEZI|nr:hypothetical protein EJ08DRAFT_44096 [Tothia fuscella]